MEKSFACFLDELRIHLFFLRAIPDVNSLPSVAVFLLEELAFTRTFGQGSGKLQKTKTSAVGYFFLLFVVVERRKKVAMKKRRVGGYNFHLRTNAASYLLCIIGSVILL